MCGIFGILKTNAMVDQEDLAKVSAASILIQHRGPDDEGSWNNQHAAFSFRRLSIIDLSPGGHQPMISDCGNYTIIFNGEIYNYLEIRDQLTAKGHHFRSRSDTEVLLQALIEWGPEALTKCNGMFALAFWNAKNKTVLVARDHVGMKPLYYSFQNGTFVFGSQLDQIMLFHKRKELTVDKTGLAFFLSLGYYPSPRTVFTEIKQLEPGKWMLVSVQGEVQQGEHFNLLSFYRNHRDQVATDEELQADLAKAVQRHLMSDVPLGTFLSGGLDSGIITGLTQKILGKGFTAYTLSNKGTPYDEADRAVAVARYLGVPHKIVYPANIPAAIKSFQHAYQEPFGDYSAIPSMLVTAEARKDVKVMLSGDGSDEFFFGYNRMTSMLKAGNYYRYPFWVRRGIKKLNPGIPAITFRSFDEMVFARQSFASEETLKEIGVEKAVLAEEFARPFGEIPDVPVDIRIKLNTIHRYFQLQLLKLDRASMYNSIEARVPFADKELLKHTIAYAASDATRDDFVTRKVPLQKIYRRLYPEMPQEEGRKKGFTIDMESMLSHELKEQYADLLQTKTLFSDWIDFKGIRATALNGKSLNTFSNWFLFSLQTWSINYYKD